MTTLRPLVIINNHNSLTQLKICADIMAQGHEIAPIAISTASHFEKARQIVAEIGIATCWENEAASQRTSALADTASPSANQSLKSVAMAVVNNSSLGQYARDLNIRRKLKAARRRATTIFDEHRPTVLLSMSDRTHDYMEAALLLEARRRRIRIILPYVAHYDVEGALGYRRGADGNVLPEYASWLRPTLYKLWSARLLRGTLHEGVFFQQPFLLNAHRRSGSMSSFPWWVGNGLSDIVCVNSFHSHEVYRRHRVPESKLRIVGDIFYDTLFALYGRRAALRDDLVKKYGLSPGRKLIVLAMPQYLEQGYFDAPRHWAEIDRIVASLCEQDADLMISLHPRMNADHYRHLSGKFACRIAEERLAAILPAADLFVAHYSSTVEWAVLCGVPAIVVDALDKPLSLFNHLTSVRVVKPPELMAAAQQALTQPVDCKDDWLNLSREQVFDGQTAERYRRLMKPSEIKNP